MQHALHLLHSALTMFHSFFHSFCSRMIERPGILKEHMNRREASSASCTFIVTGFSLRGLLSFCTRALRRTHRDSQR